jgi:outer membrane assembly lipoprotein YfgL
MSEQQARARFLPSLLIGLAATLLAACASYEKPDPTPLEPLTPKIGVRQVWTRDVGSVSFPLSVAVHAGTFTLATDDGTVLKLRADTGAEIWRTDIDARLTAGVGSDGRVSAVVTRDNELVALDGAAIIWRARLPSRVITAPLVAGERVFVVGIDRSVHAFDAFDGRKLWSMRKPGDALTLSQAGVLMPFKDTLLVGQSARLAGLDPLEGSVRWEVTLASPRGTNEVERLADLVGPASRMGDMVCGRAFQAAVACLNAERGSLLWTRPAGGTVGVGADDAMVVGGDASDRVSAWRTSDGSVAWTNEALLYRGLSAPLVTDKRAVMGDVEGIVHWLSREDGSALLRLSTDSSAIRVAPVLSGQTTLVVTSDGGLFAFRPE